MARSDSFGTALAKYVIETEFGDHAAVAAAEGVEPGDTVAVTYDNRYDRRFADETTTEGEVEWAEREPTSGGEVVLRIDGPKRLVIVTANGEVGVKKPDERAYNTVGVIQDSRPGEEVEG